MSGTRVTRVRGEMAGIRRESAIQRSLENACLLAKVCTEFRGQDVAVLDVTNVTSLFDFFVIATGNNRRQLRAMADSADDVMQARDSLRLGCEGSDGPWICHDFGDVVLHVFTPDGRALYDLENLWGDAVHVDWKPLADQLKSPVIQPRQKQQQDLDLDEGLQQDPDLDLEVDEDLGLDEDLEQEQAG